MSVSRRHATRRAASQAVGWCFDALVAFALINVVLIDGWRNFTSPRQELLLVAPHFLEGLLGQMLLLGTGGGILTVLLRLVRRYGRGPTAYAHAAASVTLVFPIACIRSWTNAAVLFPLFSVGWWESKVGFTGLCLVGGAVAITLLVLIARWGERTTWVVRRIGFALVPFLLYTSWQSVQSLLLAVCLKTSEARSTETASRHRVVWVIFDELGKNYLEPPFAPPGRHPEWERLTQEAVSATQVVSPAPWTMLSIPALLRWRDVRRPLWQGEEPSPFNVVERWRPYRQAVPANSRWVRDVFSEAKTLGFRSAVIGDYLPYCALYGASLDFCASYNSPIYDFTDGVLDNAVRVLRRAVTLRNFDAPQVYEATLANAKRLTADRDFDLVFVHFLLPHLPRLYDVESGRPIASKDYSEPAYRDNLRLVDKTIGELRRHLERTGLWDETTLLISSDHAVHRSRCWVAQHEAYDARIPFLLKMAGQKTGVALDSPFNSVISAHLVRSILVGEVTNPAQLITKIEGLQQMAPSPVLSEAWCQPGRDPAAFAEH